MCQQLRQCAGSCQLDGAASSSSTAEADEPDTELTPMQVTAPTWGIACDHFADEHMHLCSCLCLCIWSVPMHCCVCTFGAAMRICSRLGVQVLEKCLEAAPGGIIHLALCGNQKGLVLRWKTRLKAYIDPGEPLTPDHTQ